MEQVLRHRLHVFPSGRAALGRGWWLQGFCHRCAPSPDTYFSIVFCSSKFTFKISIPSCYCLKASSSFFNKKVPCFPLHPFMKVINTEAAFGNSSKNASVNSHHSGIQLRTWRWFLSSSFFFFFHWTGQGTLQIIHYVPCRKCPWFLMHPTHSCEHKSGNREQI